MQAAVPAGAPRAAGTGSLIKSPGPLGRPGADSGFPARSPPSKDLDRSCSSVPRPCPPVWGRRQPSSAHPVPVMGRGPGGAQLPPPLAGCRPVTRALPPPPEQIQGSSPAGPGPHVASGGKPAGVCWWTGQQCLKPGDGQVPSGHLSCGLGLGEGHPVARLATPVLTGPEGPGDPDLTSVLWGPSPFSSVGRPASQHVVSLPQPSAPPPGLGSRSVFSFCWEGWAGLALAGPGGLRPPPPSSVCRSQRPGGPARSGCGRVHSAARPPGRLAPPGASGGLARGPAR